MLGSPDSALVILSPGDSVDSAIEQVRQTEADQIDLLVSDGNRALHSISACEKLRQVAQKAGKSVTIYSSDEKTCDAALLCKLAVVRIEASVPSPAHGQRPAATVPPKRPAANSALSHTGAALGAGIDEDFFTALEQVPEATPPTTTPRGFQELGSREEDIFRDDIDEDWASILDEFSQAPIGEQQPRSRGADDEWANAFDNLSESMATETTEQQPSWDQPAAHSTPQANEPAEDDEERRPASIDHDERRSGLLGGLFGRRRRGAREMQLELEPAEPIGLGRPELSEQEQEERDRERRNLNLIPLLILLGILLLVGAFVVLNQDSPDFEVAIKPPLETATRTFDNIAISYEALSARPINTTAAVSITGEVQEETLTPVSQARGVLQLANTIRQPITLSKGQTVVVGTNKQGQQVRFFVDENVTIPAAQQTFTGYQFGIAEAAIVAVAGGPEYNLPENSTLSIEDLGSSVLVRNPAPISGGESRPLKIVTEQDINKLLREGALHQLANSAQSDLQLMANQSGMAIAGGTYTPTVDLLINQPGSYEVSSIPPLGQPAEDGQFTLVVRGTFTALAVPADMNVAQKIRDEIYGYLSQIGQNPDQFIIGEPRVVYEGQRLVASVDATPKGGVLSETTRQQISAGIAGKSRANAEAFLKRLQDQGFIDGYQLPPGEEWLPPAADITIREVQ